MQSRGLVLSLLIVPIANSLLSENGYGEFTSHSLLRSASVSENQQALASEFGSIGGSFGASNGAIVHASAITMAAADVAGAVVGAGANLSVTNPVPGTTYAAGAIAEVSSVYTLAFAETASPRIYWGGAISGRITVPKGASASVSTTVGGYIYDPSYRWESAISRTYGEGVHDIFIPVTLTTLTTIPRIASQWGVPEPLPPNTIRTSGFSTFLYARAFSSVTFGPEALPSDGGVSTLSITGGYHQAILPGDFDENGVVNGADLSKWQVSYAVDGGADANGDGISDGADLMVWQRQLGMTSISAATIAVPEACSLVPLSFSVILAVIALRPIQQ